jgi:spore cortex formation protein SpoVR/YcgB (stage V sporulation)
MLDAYSAVGMPLMYTHWTFGEQFIREQEAYKRGYMGLAYEIVINSEPCIAYLMEENTMLMQTLVTAHASFGHNYFFRNNYLFKQWTDAGSIIDYLAFAKKYIADCEEKYGVDKVEALLDAAHAVMRYGVDKYKRPPRLSSSQEEHLRKDREAYIQSQLNEVWNTVPRTKFKEKKDDDDQKFPKEPQENILYFIEKNAPRMEPWEREIVRIVRKVAQYFYPQGQTKLMNEGCATYFHYKLIHDLYDEGVLDDGALLEFYDSHTAVVRQLDFDHKRFSGINPYALGFAMFKDIERVAMNPTDEDRDWFGKQDWVGCGDYVKAIKFAIAGFKDESFIQQFLSPKIIRDFKLFNLHDDEADPKYLISGIHNQQGYKIVRDALSKQYNFGYIIPDIQVSDVDRWGDRTLTLKHFMVNRRPLEPETTEETLKHLATLWGYGVKLESVDENHQVRHAFEIKDGESLIDVFLDDGSKAP